MAERIRVQRFVAPTASGAANAPLDPAFAQAWNERLSRSRHANFTFSLDYLAYEAARGNASRAMLVEDGERRGLMVLREVGSELVSGYPWRWQIAIEGADPASPQGMSRNEALWFFDLACRAAGASRLRFYSPHPLGSSRSFRGSPTVLVDLVHSTEEQLFGALGADRRRLSRRSEKQGYQVIDATTAEQRLEFQELIVDTGVRRHGLSATGPAALAEEARQWEMPWHWVLIAMKNGKVAAGLGLGRQPGGMVDARASGCVEEAMKIGTNSQVWWESIRRSRLAGHSWFNLGGTTIFKRRFGGIEVPIYCALGGAPQWAIPNFLEKWRHEGVALALKARDRFGKKAATE